MISIVITAYNVEKWIEQAVRSALEQTYKDLEVVVVEDCPTDGTGEILAKLQEEYPEKLRIIKNEKNVGAGMSRRIGITAAKGERFLLLDGDDWIDPDFIEHLYEKYVDTGADIVSGGITVRKEDGSYEATCYGEFVNIGAEKVTAHFQERIVFMNNKLINKELHELVPYCKRRYIEDTPTIAPMLYLANKVAYTNHAGYHYRMRSSSLTHNSSTFKHQLYVTLCSYDMADFFKDKGNAYLHMFSYSRANETAEQVMAMKPSYDEMKEHEEAWAEMCWQYAKNKDYPKAIGSVPPMFVVSKGRKVAFTNVENQVLLDLKKIMLHDAGYTLFKTEAEVNKHMGIIPSKHLVLMEEMKLWENENGEVKKTGIWSDPVQRLAHIYYSYVAGEGQHPVFSHLKGKSWGEFLQVISQELQKPFEYQHTAVRKQALSYKREDVEDFIYESDLKQTLEYYGYEVPEGLLDVKRYEVPEDVQNIIRQLYKEDYNMIQQH